MILKYNTFIDSEELLSEISKSHLQNLAEIFVKYNAHNRLGPLLPSQHGFRFADILEVEFHLQDGWKSLDTFRVSDVGIERQWGFSPFEIQF